MNEYSITNDSYILYDYNIIQKKKKKKKKKRNILYFIYIY